MVLERSKFRETVLKRDGHRCVICGRSDVKLDAHHIIERRLFIGENEFGGYFVDNGASLCDDDTPNCCHVRAETTLITPEEIREKAGIKKTILPEHLYSDQVYTKWGDPVMSDGRRLRGELFHDESVQKVLALGDVLKLYTKYVRHPRTYHLPYSGIVVAGGDIGDDKVLPNTKMFEGRRVIVSVKMDGSQSTAYNDYLHGRSPEFRSNETWHWLLNLHSSFRHDIPDGWRVNLENLWGGRTNDINYKNLRSYALAFMVWNDKNVCLGWDETLDWIGLLGLYPVDVIYDGIYDEERIKALWHPVHAGDPMEGFIVRAAESFAYKDFHKNVAKFVRAEHKVRHGGMLTKNELTS
jgi:hypothetical protein